jgi:signal transduction histidine kinase/ActR/RegA family two-component response regulator
VSVRPHDEHRFLVLAPTLRDADVCRRFLAEAGIQTEVCHDAEELCEAIRDGAAAALLTEEALAGGNEGRLATALAAQPPWSDFPLLVLVREGMSSPLARSVMETLGNVTLLERPLRVPTLVSAALSAMRARRRQYQIRGHLEETERVADALRRADQNKDEFLAMLSHELRNPLAPIRNALYVLGQRDIGADAAERMRAMMERQFAHLVRLVDDLLDVSRILRGRVALRTERLDLGAVIARAVETAQPLIDAQGHQLTVTKVPTQLEIEGDPVRLSQVFANLLNNAAKYTPGGGHLSVSVERSGDEAVIRVRDDGVGIEAGMLPRVFDLFTQAEPSLDRSQGGLGLGLTLVRRLVEMHGGAVEAASAGLGLGAEFTVRLPLPRNPAPRSGAEQVTRLQTESPRRVLVVDDNVDAAESLSDLLRLAGHRVRVAYRGEAALALAHDFGPEVILLDIGLPGMTGFEVARELRRLASADFVLVAVTGYGQEADRRRSKEAGFDLHVTKPLEIEDLARVFQHAPRPTA